MRRMLWIALSVAITTVLTGCMDDQASTPLEPQGAVFETGGGGGGGEGPGEIEPPPPTRTLCHIGQASGLILNIPLFVAPGYLFQGHIAQAGPMADCPPDNSGQFTQGLLGFDNFNVAAQSLGTQTRGSNGSVASTASLANLRIFVPNVPHGVGNVLIQAQALRSDARASCTDTRTAGTSGLVIVDGLTVDTQPLDAQQLAKAKSGLSLANGLLTLFIDQQIVETTADGATTRTVNGLHLIGNGPLAGLDIVASQAIAGMQCP